jgi:hypothetical protein
MLKEDDNKILSSENRLRIFLCGDPRSDYFGYLTMSAEIPKVKNRAVSNAETVPKLEHIYVSTILKIQQV